MAESAEPESSTRSSVLDRLPSGLRSRFPGKQAGPPPTHSSTPPEVSAEAAADHTPDSADRGWVLHEPGDGTGYDGWLYHYADSTMVSEDGTVYEFSSVGAITEPSSGSHPAPEPAAEPAPEAKAEQEPDPEPEPEPQSGSTTDSAPEAESELATEAETESEPSREPEREATSEAEREHEPDAQSLSGPEAKANPDSEAEAQAQAEPEPEPTAEADPGDESAAKAESEHETETKTETKTETETKAEDEPDHESADEPRHDAEPTPESDATTASPSVPRFIEYSPSGLSSYVLGAVVLVASVGAALLLVTGTFALAVVLAIIAIAAGVALSSWSPGVITVRDGVLEVSTHRRDRQFDLRDPGTSVEFGDKGGPRWTARFGSPDGDRAVIRAHQVKPRQFTEIVQHYRAHVRQPDRASGVQDSGGPG